MSTVTLPADKFDKTMTFVRPATAPSRVPLDKLAVLPGFNTRTKDADYNERVARITQSIVDLGYFDDKPFAVTMLPNDETVYIYDGEHRFDASKAAVLDGAEFPEGLPVAWAKDGATVRDLTIHLARGNEGEKLNMVESAAVVRRLLDLGLDKAEVAKELGYSARHVENLITLGGSNATVKKAVAEGKIAGAEAVKLVRKHGAKDAGDKITEQVKAAEAKGKAKATPKSMATGPKMKRIEETVSLATGTSMASLLASISSLIQSHVKLDDDEALTEDGKLILAIHVIDHEGIAAAEAAAKDRAEKAAAREVERAAAAEVRAKEKAERDAAKAKAADEKAKKATKEKAAKDKAAAAAAKAKPAAEAKTPAATKTRTARPKAADKAAATPAPETPPAGDKGTDDGMGGL